MLVLLVQYIDEYLKYKIASRAKGDRSDSGTPNGKELGLEDRNGGNIVNVPKILSLSTQMLYPIGI